MTHITAVYGADTLTLTARGHATGSPAACAGVSALLYALEGWADLSLPQRGRVAPQGRVRESVEQGEASPSSVFRLAGDGESHLPPLGEGIAAIAPGRADFALPRTPEAEAAFDLVVTGLRRIAATAPAAVAVEIISAVRVLTGDAWKINPATPDPGPETTPREKKGEPHERVQQ